MQISFWQASLRKLMGTIEQAEPFFIFCIRSNSEKVNSETRIHDFYIQIIDMWISPDRGINDVAPNFLFTPLQKELHFDDELVLQQIKHIGILQIVHIQKSGYTAKYSFKVCTRVVKRLL